VNRDARAEALSQSNPQFSSRTDDSGPAWRCTNGHVVPHVPGEADE